MVLSRLVVALTCCSVLVAADQPLVLPVVDDPASIHAAPADADVSPRIHNPAESFACHSTDDTDRLFHKFHSEASCNRVQFNAYKRNYNRHARYQYLTRTGRHTLVPDQKTVTCPAIVDTLYPADTEMGYDASWIVENQASTPVVLSYVDREDGLEYSALHPNLSPLEDPEAVLQPGQWKHVHTHEGHVFHARELLENNQLGRVLLQHRTGMIAVGEKMAAQLTCSLDDPVPLAETEEGTVVIDPAYQRTSVRKLIECNQLNLSFRNRAGCPLHGYHVRPQSCQEVFKLHLGVDDKTPDFHWDWASPTKYESSYIGNVFVFRLATHANGTAATGNSQVVDRVELRATVVTDCPDLKQQSATAIASPDIALELARQDLIGSNATNASLLAWEDLSPWSTVRAKSVMKRVYGKTSNTTGYAFSGMYSM